MILQALTRYYEDLVAQGKIARPGWIKTRINYALSISPEGVLEDIVPLLVEEGKKKPQPQSFDLPAPVKRTVGIDSNFLWDNASYLLGIGTKDKPERSKKCFEACKELHLRLLEGVESTTANGICNFFRNWLPERATDYTVINDNLTEITTGANLLFRVKGIFAHEDPLIREVWQKYYDESAGKVQQCLVTGEMDTIPQVHPAIKGVDGAQSSGAAIVSFNAPAFCSYGQEQNNNAPIGRYAAFAYTAALNYLLSERSNVQKIGDTSIVCWADGGEPQYRDFTFAALFGKEDTGFSESDLKDILRRLAEGKSVPERKLESDRPFYVLGLSPNAARISIRFFYKDSFGKLMRNVNAHHERMRIVRPSYERNETIPLWFMLRETVNPNARDKTANPVMAGATLRAIFTGGLYPASLLEQTMLRIRMERSINRGKAAIIKAYFLRNQNEECPKEVLTVALNETSTNQPYVLGRLFSVYEAIQEAANPGINATIRDKYYNSAAATPARIFPLLDNLCQKHLRKLPQGSRIWYEKQILTLTEKLGEEYPSRLSLPEQGSFNLGYYHQTQRRYEKKEK